MSQFINETGFVFVDISSETQRVYHFPNGRKYVINNPQRLNIAPSQGHRVWDGVRSHYIMPSEGWAISWEVHPGQPHFSF